MVPSAVRVAVLGALTLVGGTQAMSSFSSVADDPRVLYAAAQWKVATGDDQGAYRLVQRASVKHAPTPVQSARPRATAQCSTKGHGAASL